MGGFTFFSAFVSACVGPFIFGGAVEALNLAVCLGALRPGLPVPDFFSKGPGKDPGAVAGPVVSHHCSDGDPVLCKEVFCPLPKPCGSLFAPVIKDF